MLSLYYLCSIAATKKWIVRMSDHRYHLIKIILYHRFLLIKFNKYTSMQYLMFVDTIIIRKYNEFLKSISYYIQKFLKLELLILLKQL